MEAGNRTPWECHGSGLHSCAVNSDAYRRQARYARYRRASGLASLEEEADHLSPSSLSTAFGSTAKFLWTNQGPVPPPHPAPSLFSLFCSGLGSLGSQGRSSADCLLWFSDIKKWFPG